MNKLVLGLAALATISLSSCSSDDDAAVVIETNNVTAPDTYVFERNGNTTVSFSGQTTRILMADEIVSGLSNTANTETILDNMFAHQEGANDFSDAALNASDKSVRSKTAASTDFFSANTTDATAIKAEFDALIENQVNVVFPNWDNTASAGNAGQIQEAGGGSIRYVNTKGLENNQAFAKGLIGGLMVDQMLNNYLGAAVLDAGDNRANNDAGVLDGDNNYTTMEHKWDEAYGYLYGNEANPAVPTLEGDNFLNKYLSRVEGDDDFAGIAMDVYNAFKLGRAAIVAKNYDVRDAQAQIIREKISQVIGVRAVYYLQQGKTGLGSDWASAFHDLSEGYGFVYSLQFTRKPGTNEPYFTKAEVDAFTTTLMSGNGFWDVTAETLDTISNAISAEFSFTTGQTGS
ncbi:uncharacterized protein DUF4856 [Lacinutrix venerupis]|uniref:DUF4856 domain-containing protein n=1 Tax=Lacinutrix venerupis TaxID=1486034 RepID=UPI000EAEBDAA|nr:DUF4856 domain-containing protein [Lacinutrix venerupis]RLJ64326.1 uncharacterized protein DUF4856 [Lacinutrix venerupis]